MNSPIEYQVIHMLPSILLYYSFSISKSFATLGRHCILSVMWAAKPFTCLSLLFLYYTGRLNIWLIII